MPDLLLTAPGGYDPKSQAIVGFVAASLDDQSRRLREKMAGLSIEHLEWQEQPGRNTIGMLAAHLAATEIGYFYGACAGLSYQESKAVVEQRLNIDWDGALAGTHVPSLKGRGVEGYVDLLDRSRRGTHDLLKTWDDASLDTTLPGSGSAFVLSRRWILYHVLSHFAHHSGQVSSVLHGMRDRGVLGLPEKRIVF